MTKYNFHETHYIYPKLDATPLNDPQQFRLNKINTIKDYFVAGFKERESMCKRLSKYIASFDYFDVITCFICNNWQHFYCII